MVSSVHLQLGVFSILIGYNFLSRHEETIQKKRGGPQAARYFVLSA